MKHPLQALSHRQQAVLFRITFALTLLIFGIFAIIGAPLQTPAAPQGIVSFELVANVQQAQAMVDSWEGTAPLWAAFGLGFDYLFMPMYALAASVACLWAARTFGESDSPLAPAGIPLAWGAWLAGCLDALENAALLRMLVISPENPYPQIARLAAQAKFALLLAAIGYALVALGFKLWRSVR
ncbi:MAG: hypothetical protein OHK0052_17110 [Anaerolineales bacterium]